MVWSMVIADGPYFCGQHFGMHFLFRLKSRLPQRHLHIVYIRFQVWLDIKPDTCGGISLEAKCDLGHPKTLVLSIFRLCIQNTKL